MRTGPTIVLDSNCFTYFVDAMTDISTPIGNDAEQKIAVVHLYFFLEDTLYVSPTVKLEYAAIRNDSRRTQHQSFNESLISEIPPWELNKSTVDRRAAELEQFHSKIDDCRIVAEAEQYGADFLATNDGDLIKRLSPHVKKLCLMRPSEIRKTLQIRRGSKPKKLPERTSPLAKETWWSY